MDRSSEGAATAELTGTTTQRGPITAVMAANVISLTGSALTTVAVPWFVLVTTGSALRTGITAGVSVLPTVVAGVLGGALVDRTGFKRSSVLSDLLSAVAVVLIPVLYHTTGLSFGVLLLLVFAGRLLNAPGWTARSSLVPQLADLAGMSLERANSAMGVAFNASQLVGPALAGVLIAALGASNVLVIDAATFVVSALLIGLAVPAAVASGSKLSVGASYLTDLREGLGFLRRDRLTLAMSVIFAAVNFVITPLIAVVLPVYARRVLGGAVDLGVMLAAAGAGTLVGVLAYGARGVRLPRRAVFVGAFLAAAIPAMLLATLPGLRLVVAVLTIVGVAAGPIDPLVETILQERVPAALLGRVFGLVGAASAAASPLGMLVAGVLLQLAGLRATILFQTGLFLAVALGLLAVPALRELGAGPVARVEGV